MTSYKTSQLATILHTDPKTLRGYLRKHMADSHISGTVWRISSSQLEELKEHYRIAGTSKSPEPEAYSDRQETPPASESVARIQEALARRVEKQIAEVAKAYDLLP